MWFSGSLIAADVILTSAACVEYVDFLQITAGDIDKDKITGNEQIRNATQDDVIINPDRIHYFSKGNVAIIHLPIQFNLNGIFVSFIMAILCDLFDYIMI